mmetsp:Transcript_43499/g.51204  ORF Transcript_43499/g.51204 Transcript_43499/m.51204 type:complete len:214 (-) Transcript_43499:174-815(-)
MPKAFCYIRKMKDVKDVAPPMKISGCDTIGGDRVSFNSARAPESKSKEIASENLIVCPISKIEFDGIHKFSMLWSCGCILAEKVFENIELNNQCPNCGTNFKTKDVIDLTAEPAVAEDQRKQLVEKAVLKKIGKKSQAEVNKEETEPQSVQGKRTREPEEEKVSTKRQKVDVEEILQKEIDEEWKKKVKVTETKFKHLPTEKTAPGSSSKNSN